MFGDSGGALALFSVVEAVICPPAGARASTNAMVDAQAHLMRERDRLARERRLDRAREVRLGIEPRELCALEQRIEKRAATSTPRKEREP